MAAMITKNGKIVSSAVNIIKSHPDHLDKYPPWVVSIHAEHNALLKARTSVAGGTLYVIRYNGVTSKPCEGCMSLLRDAGIARIVYLQDGYIIKESIV